MTGRARVDFRELRAIVRRFETKAKRVFIEIAPAAAEAMHAEVLEVFETEGYGDWPRFAWERRGMPPPGTPMGKRSGPLTPAQDQRRAKKNAREDRARARAKEHRRQQKKLRAAFGGAMGAVERHYGGGSAAVIRPKKKRLSAKTRRQHRRFAGGGAKLLQDTGNLIGSITPEWKATYVETFTNVPYAKYHISPLPRRVIPLRDFFDIDMDRFESDVVNMILRHIYPAAAANEGGILETG